MLYKDFFQYKENFPLARHNLKLKIIEIITASILIYRGNLLFESSFFFTFFIIMLANRFINKSFLFLIGVLFILIPTISIIGENSYTLYSLNLRVTLQLIILIMIGKLFLNSVDPLSMINFFSFSKNLKIVTIQNYFNLVITMIFIFFPLLLDNLITRLDMMKIRGFRWRKNFIKGLSYSLIEFFNQSINHIKTMEEILILKNFSLKRRDFIPSKMTKKDLFSFFAIIAYLIGLYLISLLV